MEKQMNVPELRFPGFDVGWEKKKVGELCESIVPGRNKPTNFTGSIPWITTPDIEHNGIIFFSKKNLNISKEEAKKIGSKIVPVNSIIISCVGDLGLTAVTGKEIVINQQLHAFIPKEKIEYRFLLYQLNLQKKYMDKVATKTAVPYLNKENCNAIPIYYPSLPEQQKIATFLTAVDEKLQALKKKKSLLTQYKKGVMQKIFSQQLRFKNEDGKEFEEWEEKNLGEVLSIPEKIKPLKIEKNKLLTVRLYLKGVLRNDSTDGLSIGSTNYYVRKEGQFIFGKQNLFNGAFGIIPKEFDGYLSSADVPSLDINFKEINSDFLFYYFGRQVFYKGLENIASGSGSKRIHEEILLKVEIQLPCIAEQNKIANFLSSLDEKINQTQTQIDKTGQWKKGLLQKMFC